MKTATYQQLAHGDNVALNLYHILRTCREEKIQKLTFEQGTYEIDPIYCSQRVLNISNHGFNGPKRIAVLIEDMEDFEIDFGGSTFICNGIITPIAILNSKNIRLHNLTLKNPTIAHWECRVVAHGEDYIDVENVYGYENMVIMSGHMFGSAIDRAVVPMSTNIEFEPTGRLERGTGDRTLGGANSEFFYEPLDDTHVRIRGIHRKPPIGNVLMFTGARRLGSGVFCQFAQDVVCEDFDICSCYGMGMLAQVSHNITLRRFNTTRKDGHIGTIGADATHFVSCSGLVTVEDSVFVGQLDDALNVHGIYTRIVDKGETWIMARQMHLPSTGVPIFQEGNVIQMLPTDTLLPYTRKTIKRVEKVNDSCTILHLNETAEDIRVGDDVENVTLNPDVIFRHNVVRDNRARGILIGTPGKVLIEDCDFNVSGTAIKFESNGTRAFESGGTKDVTIRNNRFDDCKYGNWGSGIIECQPKEAIAENEYYHGTIRVCGNYFNGGVANLAQMDNVANFEFVDNQITDNPEAFVSLTHVDKYNIQKQVKIQK